MLTAHKIHTTKLRILKEPAKVPVYMLHHVMQNIKVRGVMLINGGHLEDEKFKKK
jgi:hypothetical protein